MRSLLSSPLLLLLLLYAGYYRARSLAGRDRTGAASSVDSAAGASAQAGFGIGILRYVSRGFRKKKSGPRRPPGAPPVLGSLVLT